MAYDELQAVIMPDGTLQLEWMPVAGRINRQQNILQNEIYEQYSAVPDSWLFFLGFCNKKINLSPSLSFWRKLSGLFVHKLSLTPDIEEPRGEVVIPLVDEELSQSIEMAPMMPGGEYLQAEAVFALWDELQKVFSQKIDEILTEKSKLSNEVVAATGENWITEMKNDELLDLFTLKL